MVQGRQSMRIATIALGALVIVIGALPILVGVNALPSFLEFVPLEGTIYYVIVIVLGVLIIINSSREKRGRIRLR